MLMSFQTFSESFNYSKKSPNSLGLESNQVLRAIYYTLKTNKLKQEWIVLGKNGWDQNDMNVRQAQQS